MTQKSFLITLLLSGVMAFSAHATTDFQSIEAPGGAVKAPAPVEVTQNNAAVAMPEASAEVLEQSQLGTSDSAAVEQEDEAPEGDSGANGTGSDSEVDAEEFCEETKALAEQANTQAKEAEEAKVKFEAERLRLAQVAQKKAAAAAEEEEKIAQEKAARKDRKKQENERKIKELKEIIEASRLEKEAYELEMSKLLAAAAEEKAVQEAADKDLAQRKAAKDQEKADKKTKAALAQASAVAPVSGNSAQLTSDKALAEKLAAEDQVRLNKQAKAAAAQGSSVVAPVSGKSAQEASDKALAQKTADQDQAKTEELRKAAADQAAAEKAAKSVPSKTLRPVRQSKFG